MKNKWFSVCVWVITAFFGQNIFCAVDIYVNSSEYATVNGKKYQCAIGKGGITLNKREGDGATPIGAFALRKIYYRADRMPTIRTGLPTQALNKTDGWCDEPTHPRYNQFIQLPVSYSHEEFWREDNTYDIIIEVGYNDNPVVPYKGSAIFIHIARANYSPTAGGIVFAQEDLLEIIPLLTMDSKVIVEE